MRRVPTVAWAALVFALLVLPPALSAGQDTGTADPVATPPAPAPAAPQGEPGQGGQQDAGAGGEPSGGDQPAGDTTTVSAAPATTATAGPKEKDGLAKAAASLSVSIGDNFYSPKSISVDVGDTVTWTNDGVAQHSATASDGSFDTGVFGPGGSRSATFSQPGTFDYFCTVHGTAQSGTVLVGSGGGGGGGDQSEADAVASSGAAGSSTSLPSTGSNVLPPMAVGVMLLFAGLALRLRNWFGPA